MITDKKQTSQESKIKSYKKLGYTKLESAEIVVRMNQFLSNLHVFNQKVKAFHWNLTGGEFFDLHEQFEQLYHFNAKTIDEVAERVRVFGHYPTSLLSSYLETAEIKEHKEKYTSFEMMKELRDDMEILIDDTVNIVEASIDAGDLGTQDMANGMLKELEKRHWMYTSYLAE